MSDEFRYVVAKYARRDGEVVRLGYCYCQGPTPIGTTNDVRRVRHFNQYDKALDYVRRFDLACGGSNIWFVAEEA